MRDPAGMGEGHCWGQPFGRAGAAGFRGLHPPRPGAEPSLRAHPGGARPVRARAVVTGLRQRTCRRRACRHAERPGASRSSSQPTRRHVLLREEVRDGAARGEALVHDDEVVVAAWDVEDDGALDGDAWVEAAEAAGGPTEHG